MTLILHPELLNTRLFKKLIFRVAMPKKQVTVKSDSLENLTSNATGGSTRSRRRVAEAVNYRESGGDDTLDSRKKMAVSPDDFPEPDAPIVRKKKPGRAKKVVIVSENNDLDIFGAIEEDAPPPPVKETSAKGWCLNVMFGCLLLNTVCFVDSPEFLSEISFFNFLNAKLHDSKGFPLQVFLVLCNFFRTF